MKKLGRIPEGGGKRIAPGFAETRSGPRPGRSLGLEYLHVAVDDTSRPCPNRSGRSRPSAAAACACAGC